MSVLFEINSSIKNYQVEVMTNMLERGAYQSNQNFILVDSLVLKLYPFLQSENLIAIPAIEESKSLNTVAYAIENLRSLGANRNSRIIAIGGGIIQDIATFTASVFMRGITWSYYPTTLLGMVDSCIGGKSSINVGQYKNIAGNFYPPERIVVDTNFCGTLQHAELISGLCEAVKICFADRNNKFNEYLKLTNQVGMIPENDLAKAITLSLLTKKEFIEEDEFDTGVRLLLNFGHTFGHAIEAAGNFSITHGVAVGVGMQIAIHLSSQLDPKVKESLRVRKLESYLSVLLSSIEGLASNLKAISAELMFKKFQSDKKHINSEYVIIIPNGEGYLERKFVNKSDEFEQLLINSFESIKGLYEV
jgi:3-dehydroquinate synthase